MSIGSTNWVKVKFNVVVTKNRVPQENVTVWYEVAQDMMHPLLKDTIVLENGVLTLDAGTMKTPGFLRCRVWTKYDGRTVEGRATAAFEPEDKTDSCFAKRFQYFLGKCQTGECSNSYECEIAFTARTLYREAECL